MMVIQQPAQTDALRIIRRSLLRIASFCRASLQICRMGWSCSVSDDFSHNQSDSRIAQLLDEVAFRQEKYNDRDTLFDGFYKAFGIAILSWTPLPAGLTKRSGERHREAMGRSPERSELITSISCRRSALKRCWCHQTGIDLQSCPA